MEQDLVAERNLAPDAYKYTQGWIFRDEIKVVVSHDVLKGETQRFVCLRSASRSGRDERTTFHFAQSDVDFVCHCLDLGADCVLRLRHLEQIAFDVRPFAC